MVRLITTNSELGCGAAAQTEQEIRKVLTGSEIIVLQMNLDDMDCGTIKFFFVIDYKLYYSLLVRKCIIQKNDIIKAEKRLIYINR